MQFWLADKHSNREMNVLLKNILELLTRIFLIASIDMQIHVQLLTRKDYWKRLFYTSVHFMLINLLGTQQNTNWSKGKVSFVMLFS